MNNVASQANPAALPEEQDDQHVEPSKSTSDTSTGTVHTGAFIGIYPTTTGDEFRRLLQVSLWTPLPQGVDLLNGLDDSVQQRTTVEARQRG